MGRNFVSYGDKESRLTGGSSSGLAALCSTMVFAALQVYKTQLGATRVMTILAGYVSSWLFVFMLICVSSLEQMAFGSGFQAQLTEVCLCLLVACGAAAMVHRVSCTVCFICSIVALYFINRISTAEYQNKMNAMNPYMKKKKGV